MKRMVLGVGYLALVRGDDAGTIGAYETGSVLSFEDLGNSCHVMLWDSFRNRNDKRNFCGNGLHMSISSRSIEIEDTSRIASAANGGGTKMAVASATR